MVRWIQIMNVVEGLHSPNPPTSWELLCLCRFPVKPRVNTFVLTCPCCYLSSCRVGKDMALGLVCAKSLQLFTVVPRVKPHTGATARENPQDPSVIAR